MKEKDNQKFSLKDELFNASKVEKIACEIKEVYNTFEVENFQNDVLGAFPSLELKARISHISDMLKRYLPDDYTEATTILLEALPSELDNSKSDDDFGDFIYAPYSEFVMCFGCEEQYIDFSLKALREMTKRFSVEFSIRDFINKYPTQTLEMLEACAKSDNYHERRLASEGLRPKLPWAKKLTLDYLEAAQYLEYLFYDNTRYVTRSVANHLNDIAKIDPDYVVETLKRWSLSNKQVPKEMEFITKHSLRTLVKKGHVDALEMLGFVQNPNISLAPIQINKKEISIGEALIFDVEIKAGKDSNLMVDYIVYFQTKSGTLSPKVHKLKQISIKENETIVLRKRHPFKKNMTTRKLYEGKHKLALQINGKIVEEKYFNLKV